MISHLRVLLVSCTYVGRVYFFKKKKEKKEELVPDPSNPSTDSMLCKFVMDGTGKKIGESVSVDNDVLIIKSGVQFLGVPLKHIESTDKILVVKGLFDFTKAIEMGEKWRKESYRDMNQKDGVNEPRGRI